MRLSYKLAGVILILLILIGVLLETALSSRKHEPAILAPHMKGVIKYDRAKAYDGVNITYGYTAHSGCLIFNNDGTKSKFGPGKWCKFIPGEGMVSGISENVKFLNTDFDRKWKENFNDIHHVVNVDMVKREILVVDNETVEDLFPGINVKSNTIIGLDFSGNRIYEWKLSDHIQEISEAFEHDDFFDRTKPGTYKIAHINNLQIVPAGIEHLNPAFKPGNFLLTLLLRSGMIIVDRETGKVVWSYANKDYSGDVHSARFMKDGNIVYFKNHESKADFVGSEVVIIDSVQKKEIWNYRAEKSGQFFSKRFGNVQELPNGNLLITDNPNKGGRVFELTRDKEVVWEWANPHFDEDGKRTEVFQVMRLPAEEFVDFFND